VTVPDLMFVSARIPYVSAQLGARYAIPLNAFCVGPGLVRVQGRGYIRMKYASRVSLTNSETIRSEAKIQLTRTKSLDRFAMLKS
jgi:hypothetical protein